MWILFLALLAPITPFFDFYCAHFFYSQQNGFYNNAVFASLFQYGELFGLMTGVLTSGICVVSLFYKKWIYWRRGALAMVLTLAIGAGLIVNSGFKEYWGRPRPKQVIEFGGKHEYRPFWRPDFHTTEPQRSFPSGHVAMGFYFLSLVLVGKRYRSRLLRNIGLVFVICLGGGLMVARVAQGGHFFSDVIVSPIVMWYVAKGIDWYLFTSVGWGAQILDSNIHYISQESDGD
jgi:membrane-associated PAP2 superfamily phosphatase